MPETKGGDGAQGSAVETLDERSMRETPWHARTGEQALEALESGPDGLTDEESGARRERVGDNRLPERESAGVVRVVLRQFKDPLIYILLIAAVVSAATQNFNNAIFIGAVLIINTVVGALQELKAESSAEALKETMSIKARVLRDGEQRTVDAALLAPGDVVLVESGDAVPADLRLLSTQDLRLDESLLTGESTPVAKTAEAAVEPDAAVGDRETLAHAGSSVLRGRARGVVCRTGAATEVGRIAKSLTEEGGEVPPLVIRLRRLTRLIAVFVLGAIFVLGGLQLIRGEDWLHIFFLAVALAVSAIPAGLPVAITVALSIATARMAKRNVIVRLLPAVEGLGACTLIASDKTGTLTANVLTVKRLVLPSGRRVAVTGEGHELEGDLRRLEDGGEAGEVSEETRDGVCRLVETGVLCNEATMRETEEGEVPEGDTVDVALLVLARKMGIGETKLRDEHARIGSVPFESERRYAATFDEKDGAVVAHVKGATERVLSMCRDVDEKEVSRLEDGLAADGFRVIALARGEVDGDPARAGDEGALEGLTLLGLVGLIDPIREEVPDAVRRCHDAGVDVRMVTGDHPSTAMAIARRLGISREGGIAVTGAELAEAAEDSGPKTRIREAAVFARVEPTQKTHIVDELQEAGHFVAVTGDGANDAPALRRAHIGVAMGSSGTDVARGAADLILTDDNFSSIVAGIEEGRIAYDNVRKVTWLLLATGAGEVLLFFLGIGLGFPLPLMPVQLLWLNLVTNGIQDVALAFEKGEPDVLSRAPRPPDERVFNGRMVEQVLLSGAYIGLISFAAYYYMLEHMGMPIFETRNVLLLFMVLLENVHIFSCRSEERSTFRVSLRANLLLILTVVAAHGVHIGSMFVPGLSDVLQVQPVDLSTWGVLLGMALTLLLFDEGVKLARHLVRRLRERRSREQ
jgi:magnesium-transporting ATPase (P-type)